MKRIIGLLLWLGCLSSQGMAVDRAKFRTCDQTSFCRRHRDDHSSRLYRYRLVKDSVLFHGIPKEDGENGGKDKGESKTGLWKSLQRNLGLHGDHNDGKHKGLDPYVRGPEATMTGLLVNAAAETGKKVKEHQVLEH